MSKYYVLHFRDGEKMDFGKKCEVVDVGGGMVRFMTKDSEKNHRHGPNACCPHDRICGGESMIFFLRSLSGRQPFSESYSSHRVQWTECH